MEEDKYFILVKWIKEILKVNIRLNVNSKKHKIYAGLLTSIAIKEKEMEGEKGDPLFYSKDINNS
jgi:hypothetical protein